MKSKINMIFLLIVVAIAAMTHLAGIRSVEFTGEDETMFMQTAISVIQADDMGDKVKTLGSFYYPPLQSLLAIPFIWYWGPSEWTVRMGGALCGVLAAPLLFLLVLKMERDRRIAWVASLLYACGGIAANNMYALTGGSMALGTIVAAMGLVGFVLAKDPAGEHRAMFMAAAGLVWMMMTIPDGYFYLPVFAVVYIWKRGWKLTAGTLPALGLVLAWFLFYAYAWIWMPQYWRPGQPGGLFKIQKLISQLGTCKIRDLVLSIWSASSWITLLLGVVFLPAGIRRAPAVRKWFLAFFGLPLFLWTFVFGYSNVRAAHLLFAFPLFCVLWACGAVKLADQMPSRGRLLHWIVPVLVIWSLASSALQTYVLHMRDLPLPGWASALGLVLDDYFPQGRRFIRRGLYAAGYALRRSDSHLKVISNVGWALGDYYAKRSSADSALLPQYVASPETAKADMVRYFVCSLADPIPGNVNVSTLQSALTVQKGKRPVLIIYDLWRETPVGHLADADEFQKKLARRIQSAWKIQYGSCSTGIQQPVTAAAELEGT